MKGAPILLIAMIASVFYYMATGQWFKGMMCLSLIVLIAKE